MLDQLDYFALDIEKIDVEHAVLLKEETETEPAEYGVFLTKDNLKVELNLRLQD